MIHPIKLKHYDSVLLVKSIEHNYDIYIKTHEGLPPRAIQTGLSIYVKLQTLDRVACDYVALKGREGEAIECKYLGEDRLLDVVSFSQSYNMTTFECVMRSK